MMYLCYQFSEWVLNHQTLAMWGENFIKMILLFQLGVYIGKSRAEEKKE